MNNELINDVIKIVDWYKNLPKDFSNINGLMSCRQKLTGITFFLSVELGNIRQQWKDAEFITESNKRTFINNELEQGVPVGKAIEIGKLNSLNFLGIETTYESEYHKLKFIIDSITNVNNSMMQHISVLKKEMETAAQYT